MKTYDDLVNENLQLAEKILEQEQCINELQDDVCLLLSQLGE